MNKIVIAIIIILVIGGLGWYLTADYNDTTETTNSNELTTNTTQTSPVNNNEINEIVDYAISMTDYSYSPSEIMVEGPGQTIKVKLTNNGKVPHDFVIDELDINSGFIAPGDSEIISITSGQLANTYDFYCSVGNHRGLGMFGKFIQ